MNLTNIFGKSGPDRLEIEAISGVGKRHEDQDADDDHDAPLHHLEETREGFFLRADIHAAGFELTVLIGVMIGHDGSLSCLLPPNS
ncbi:MAG: hypothetical protein RLZZ563_2502 [Pseudomonadota bacterium]|jgi:hypothetical protein